MAKPVKLPNARSWLTQTAAKAHFKDMLNRHQDGERVELDSDNSDLAALVEVYDQGVPALERKAGSGVSYFFRDREQGHNGLTSCFHIRRTDGSVIDFSYLRAVEVAAKVSANHMPSSLSSKAQATS